MSTPIHAPPTAPDEADRARHLTTADRLDILLRDADAHWPASFGARNVFEVASLRWDRHLRSPASSISRYSTNGQPL